MSGSTYFITPQNYGAVGDGVTDDTTHFQNAINALASSGGGILYIPPKSYFFSGSLVLHGGVSLQGISIGPFYKILPNTLPNTGPVMLVTSKAGSFITITNPQGGISDLVFFYPNQVTPSSSTPTAYPYTISVHANGAGGHLISRCTSINAYTFLDIEVGQVTVTDCCIGAYLIGINIDSAQDIVFLSRVSFEPNYDFYAGGSPGTNAIDSWVINNSYGIVVARCDSLRMNNILITFTYTGIYLTDSTQSFSDNVFNSYGSMSNIDIDSVRYGIIAKSTNSSASGYKISNIDIGALTGSGISAILMQSGGKEAPQVLIIGGGVRGTWAGGIVQNQLSSVGYRIAYWQGYN